MGRFPFYEHSSMKDVAERETLLARYERREMLTSTEARRLQMLQSRVVMMPERDPPTEGQP